MLRWLIFTGLVTYIYISVNSCTAPWCLLSTFFYGCELLGTYVIYNRPTPRDLYYNEPGSEMPAGNLQLLELNIALLYSWDYYMTLREGIYTRRYKHISRPLIKIIFTTNTMYMVNVKQGCLHHF